MTRSHLKGSSHFAPMLVAILYMLPLNLNIGSVGEKPIDLAVSNLLLLLIPTLFFTHRYVSQVTLLAIVMPFGFIGIGLSSAIIRGGDLGVILSALSFTLPLFHVSIGYLFGRSKSQFSFLYASYALAIVILAIFFSDLLSGSFPRGCGYQGRWGGCLGPFDVYGFPNPPMNFFAVCSPLLTLPFIRSSNLFWRVLAILALLSLVAIMPLSLSRSALLVFLIAAGALVVMAFGAMALLVYIVLCVSVIVSFQWIISLEIFSGIALRIQLAFEAGDITTGRLGIWKDAIGAWAESPFFGKAFVPFSEFSSFGTVHQQYLEVLFKSGLVGFLLFFGYIFIVTQRSYRIIARDNKYSSSDLLIFLTFGLCLFVANLFQPAISYQPLGNFMFFATGVFLSRKSAHRTLTKVDDETNPPESLHRPV